MKWLQKPGNTAIAGLALLYLLLSLLLFNPAPISVQSDSIDNLRIAGEPFFSLSFWAADRPMLAPLLFKLCGRDHAVIVTWQLILHWVS